MELKRFLYVAVLIASLVSCQISSNMHSVMPGNGSTPEPRSLQILYVINGPNVTTYSVDPNNLTATAEGSSVGMLPKSASLVQFVPAPRDHFLYVLWSNATNQQYLSVYATTRSGVPQIPPIQTLNVSSLSQFNIDPGGRFAYTLEVSTESAQYMADIRLFHIDAQFGTLNEDPQLQGSYGPAVVLPVQLYGISANRTKLYDTTASPSGSAYRERMVDVNTGTLGPDVDLYETTTTTSDVLIGASLIIEHESSFYYAGPGYLDISPNIPWPNHAVIHCTSAMLDACDNASNVQLDVSGKYLFLTDPSTQKVRVAAIDLIGKRIVDTGNSFPLTEQTPGFSFSQDGKLIYATLASDRSLHIFRFDPVSGTISSGGTPIVLPSPDSGICPATRIN